MTWRALFVVCALVTFLLGMSIAEDMGELLMRVWTHAPQ